MVKIGIRPTIDGREKGIRESLEEQTMRMAHAAARLISGNVKDEDGNAVECVLADGTIGGVAEAARCREKFEREGVCATLTVTPCWCYGSETMDMDPRTPKAVWVTFSDGKTYIGSTHDVPHSPQHLSNNNFNGHLCVHFPISMEKAQSIGPYATSHQEAINEGWAATQKLKY